MTAVYGMNTRIGNVSFPRKDEQQFDKPYSDATAQVIDEEVRLLVSTAYERTRALLQEHAAHLKAVAELLLLKETINQNDIAAIAGPRPWPMNPKLAVSVYRILCSFLRECMMEADNITYWYFCPR
jgi:ATP-dependent Zn protease